MPPVPDRKAHWPGLATVGLSLLPCLVALSNLHFLARLRKGPIGPETGVSVLIPARNEAHRIRSTLDAVIANGSGICEILVLDDNSEDDTCLVIETFDDPRLRVVRGAALPPGWCGKNHACAQLAAEATGPFLLFLDADVTLAPDAIGRMLSRMQAEDSPAMLSGVPRQITGTVLEWLLLPLIDVLLFGYLPLALDTGRHPALAAACGQLIMVRQDAYHASGGHSAIRNRLHDALSLARMIRHHGYRTVLVEATDLGMCRMYDNARDVYAGLMKNAVEGMAGARALPIWIVLLGGAHVLPFLLRSSPAVRVARCASLFLRLVVSLRCRQGVRTVMCSPFGVVLLLIIQCHARLRHLLRRPVSWKGRHYETALASSRGCADPHALAGRTGRHGSDRHYEHTR